MIENRLLESFCLGIASGMVIGGLFTGYVLNEADKKDRYKDCVVQQIKTTPESYRDMDYISTYCKIMAE